MRNFKKSHCVSVLGPNSPIAFIFAIYPTAWQFSLLLSFFQVFRRLRGLRGDRDHPETGGSRARQGPGRGAEAQPHPRGGQAAPQQQLCEGELDRRVFY